MALDIILVFTKVAPDGDVCKGTDFPGLLRPIEHSRRDRRPNAPQQQQQQQQTTTAPAAGAASSAVAETRLGEEGGGDKDRAGQGGGGGGNEGDEEGKKEEEAKNNEEDEARRKEEEEARTKEEEEEVKLLVKVGAQTLLPVLGEEVTAKVSWAGRRGGPGVGRAIFLWRIGDRSRYTVCVAIEWLGQAETTAKERRVYYVL